MFDNTRLRSPSQCASKKTYNYLNDQGASISKDRFLSGSKARGVAELSPISKQQTQYELIVQFQLRRQKEKNLILEQRLRNKQSFIKQMRQFQDELTIAFEKCQQELHYYKSQCQQYESRWNSFATFNNGVVQPSNIKDNKNVNNSNFLNNTNSIGQFNNSNAQFYSSTIVNGDQLNNDKNHQSVFPQAHLNQQLIREYVEEIAELKHLVIRLQQEINYYEKRQKLLGQNNKYLSSSVKNQFFSSKGKQSQFLKEKQINQKEDLIENKDNIIDKKKKQSKPIESQKRQLRSKTLANQFVQEKKQENFTTLNKISEFIDIEPRKISSFLNHFLTMYEFFEHSIEKDLPIKHKLKKAWKWVKTAIAEWNYLKKEKLQKVKEYKIGNIVSKMLPLTNLSIPQIQTLLQKIIKPRQKYQSSKNNLI